MHKCIIWNQRNWISKTANIVLLVLFGQIAGFIKKSSTRPYSTPVLSGTVLFQSWLNIIYLKYLKYVEAKLTELCFFNVLWYFFTSDIMEVQSWPGFVSSNSCFCKQCSFWTSRCKLKVVNLGRQYYILF